MAELDLDKLLGGFAADTLTPEERQRLFTAALRDQQLFNALADEQALKELLTDPAVRRRLLQALEQSNAAAAGDSSSWLKWLRRPAGMAWASGLATAALAVVLGTKIYQDSLRKQDSLREADQSAPIEASKPAPRSAPASPPSQPSVTEREQEIKEKTGPKTGAAMNEAPSNKTTSAKDTSKPPASKKDTLEAKQASPRPAEPTDMRSSTVRREPESLTAMKEEMRRSAPAPAPGVPEPKPMPPSAAAPPPEILAANIGARALFYAGAPIRRNRQALAKERRLGSADDAPAGARPEALMKPFSDAGLTDRPGEKLFEPLGLRYSFVVKRSDGQDREVNAATAAKSGGQARLTVEGNQDGYLQILKTAGSMAPQILFPAEETARPSFRLIGGNRIDVPLPTVGDGSPITLTVRLSREPFESGKEQEAISPGRTSAHLLTESVSPAGPTDLEEQAVYVVSRDRSAFAQIVVSIPIGQ
jgi:hypothetical protein